MPRKGNISADKRIYNTRYKDRIEETLTALKEKLKKKTEAPVRNVDQECIHSLSNKEEVTKYVPKKAESEIFAPSSSDDDIYSTQSIDDIYIPETTDESDDSLSRSSIINDEVNKQDVTIETETTNDAEAEENNDVILEKSEDEHNEEIFEKSVNKRKRHRQRDFCFYCESLVLNFARHVFRNHFVESEVQRALSYPNNSKSRKEILTILRKKGNYITNSQNDSFKPMKKSRYSRSEDYLPCTKCLGFYSRKQLWKHKKNCDVDNLTSNIQAHAQDFLLRGNKVNDKLRLEVFPHMRADKLSMVAKTDSLICAFGLQYLRAHREKHFVSVTSRKMRELAKLLIEIKKIKPSIKNLLDALKPENYGNLVLASKNAAKFDNSKDRYESPTYAMNISTSIKQCCNLALLESYKAEATVNRAEVQADLKTLANLIQSNWKYDVSSQAADDLNMKKYNKTTIVPLASDLKCLKEYLHKIATYSATLLVQSESSLNCNAYNELLESIFGRVLLLNRRRPGELQRLKLSYYLDYDKKDNESSKYEEFDRVLSATEKILVNNLKRIVIRGKRGRGVPVLFSNDVQKDIDILISVRHKYVDENNDFFFAQAGGSLLCGYKVMDKHAKLCGAKNPKTLTSTRLRKHLATLTQLLNLSENEMEQLASFMGHTLSVHKQNYRLPDDIFQTAKISKLLLLMETGNADKYKGRCLDDINLEEEIIGDDIQDDDILHYEMLESTPSNESIKTPIKSVAKLLPSCSNNPRESVNHKKKQILVPWTSEQKRVVLKFFSNHIKAKKSPKRNECENLKTQHLELLKNKDWLKIKVFVQNAYTKQ